MSDSQFPKAKRKSAVGRVILVASLALNLAVVGLVVGAALRSDDIARRSLEDNRARAMQDRDFGLGPFIAALDSEAKRAVGRGFVKKVGSSENARKDAQSKLETTIVLLTSEPFDAEAFRASLLDHHEKFAERQAIGLDLLTDYLVEMSHEDRALYAERLEATLLRSQERRDGRAPRGPGDRPEPGPDQGPARP